MFPPFLDGTAGFMVLLAILGGVLGGVINLFLFKVTHTPPPPRPLAPYGHGVLPSTPPRALGVLLSAFLAWDQVAALRHRFAKAAGWPRVHKLLEALVFSAAVHSPNRMARDAEPICLSLLCCSSASVAPRW